jgi:DNA polymerase
VSGIREVALAAAADVEEWRGHARSLLYDTVAPDRVVWREPGAATDLFAAAPGEDAPDARRIPATGAAAVPRRFLDLAERVVCNSHPGRFDLLYRMLWRIARGERKLLEISTDPDVRRGEAMASAVDRERHKMKAFVRFREATDEDGTLYLAWFEPDHHVVDAVAPFFARRFAGMRFSILTPRRSVYWDRRRLVAGPGACRADAAAEDRMEAYWRTYYASIFNPARLKLKAMKAQMPRRYWKNLPEAPLIGPLAAEAGARTAAMLRVEDSAPDALRWLGAEAMAPATGATGGGGDLNALKDQAAVCRRCPLWEPATQTVFGEGPARAPILLLGEQPGDQEDLQGRPFVGPAGAVLDKALAEAGIDRAAAYVTNAVKHFKFLVRGKRRLHHKPSVFEIKTCRYWLDEEIARVQPRLVVALGATAARAALGRTVRIGRERGRLQTLVDGRKALITVHPSFLLRLPDDDAKAREYAQFVADLRLAAPFADG